MLLVLQPDLESVEPATCKLACQLTGRGGHGGVGVHLCGRWSRTGDPREWTGYCRHRHIMCSHELERVQLTMAAATGTGEV